MKITSTTKAILVDALAHPPTIKRLSEPIPNNVLAVQ